MATAQCCFVPAPAPCGAVAVLFLGDRVVAPRGADAALQRLSSAAGACAAAQARLPLGTRVLPVPPPRYVAGGLACFDEWLLPAALDGACLPLSYPRDTGRRAWRRLAATLHAAGVSRAAPLTLLGFSKGAIVVNQLLAELVPLEGDGTASDADVSARLEALRQVHFLDAGAQRLGAAHIVDAATLAALRCELRRRGVRVWVHGTPRQWADPARPWLAQEAAEFVRHVPSCKHAIH